MTNEEHLKDTGSRNDREVASDRGADAVASAATVVRHPS